MGELMTSDFLVNTATGIQRTPSITRLSNGGFVVTWEDWSQAYSASIQYVRGQIYSANGTPSGSEFLVGTSGVSFSSNPCVADLSNGDFVVTWFSLTGTRGQVYTVGGAKSGIEFQVNGFAGYEACVTGLANGNFVVTSVHNDDSNFGIYGQIYTSSGLKYGNEFNVNTTTPNYQYDPSVTKLADGAFVVTWNDNSQSGGDKSGVAVRGQVFTANGVKSGAEFLVNTTISSDQYNPSITHLTSGFVITWNDYSQSGGDKSSLAVRGQVFTANGVKSGSEFLVNTATTDLQFEPSITGLENGGFVVTWIDRNWINGYTIRGQLFNSDGSKFGGEIVVNTTAANYLDSPSVTSLANGGFVVTWQSGNDTSVSAIRARMFNADGTPYEIPPPDVTPPVVNCFTSTNASGHFGVGETIIITAIMSEAVKNGSTFDVTLDTGDTVTLTADSQGKLLSGTYTVDASDSTGDLNITSFTSGTVHDLEGNAMTCTALPAGNNLADNKDLSINDDGIPKLSINDIAETEGGTATFTWSLDRPAGEDGASFWWYLRDGSAVFGADYGAEGHRTGFVEIPEGEQTGKIAIPTNRDNLQEGVETFEIVLRTPTNVTIQDKVGEASIFDESGQLPLLTLHDATVVYEGDRAAFKVTLDHSVSEDIHLLFGTMPAIGGGATSSDFTPVEDGECIIAANTLSATFYVQTTGDNKYEDGESFQVYLWDPDAGTSPQVRLIDRFGKETTAPGAATFATGYIAADSVTQTAAELFQHNGEYTDGKYASLAGFAAAAYVNNSQGNVSVWQGWTPLAADALGIDSGGSANWVIPPIMSKWSAQGAYAISQSGTSGPQYSLINGIFQYFPGNLSDSAKPLALVARSSDSLVISFRGVIDSGDSSDLLFLDPNPISGPANILYHDEVNRRYARYKILLDAIDSYVADESNGIKNVYLTGFDIGGGVAEEYLRWHQDTNVKYNAIVFGSWSPTLLYDDRIFAFKVGGDLTDLVNTASSTSKTSGTLVEYINDIQVAPGKYHDISLYTALTEQFEKEGFVFDILRNRDDEDCTIGVDLNYNQTTKKIESAVHDNNSIAANADYLFGGQGEDRLYGEQLIGNLSTGKNMMYGCSGDDILEGMDGDDILYGGSENDKYVYGVNSYDNFGNDFISDESGSIDKIILGNTDEQANFNTMYSVEDGLFSQYIEYDVMFARSATDGNDLLVRLTPEATLDFGHNGKITELPDSEGIITIDDMGTVDHRVESLLFSNTPNNTGDDELVSLYNIYVALGQLDYDTSASTDSTSWTVFSVGGNNNDNGGFGKSVGFIAQV